MEWVWLTAFMLWVRVAAISLFIVGLAYSLRRWLASPPTRLLWKHALEASSKIDTAGILTGLLKTLTGNLILQTYVYRRTPLRGVGHSLIFFGGMGLLLFHAIPRSFLFSSEEALFPGFPLWFRVWSHDLFAILLAAGVMLALVRRFVTRDVPETSMWYDIGPLVAMVAIVVSGALVWQIDFVPAWELGGEASPTRGLLYLVHSLMVYAVMIWYPFSKLFHWFARLSALAFESAKQYGMSTGPKYCINCHMQFTFSSQASDVSSIAPDVDPQLLEYCPDCRKQEALRRLRENLPVYSP